MKKKITIAEEIDLVNYMDAKVTQIVNSQRMWKRWAITSLIMIALALITSGYIGTKTIGGLQVKTDILWKEYVPGELFLEIVRSFDIQFQYYNAKLNGDPEEIKKAIDDIIEYRKQIIDLSFTTRGTPFEGRTLTTK